MTNDLAEQPGPYSSFVTRHFPYSSFVTRHSFFFLFVFRHFPFWRALTEDDSRPGSNCDSVVRRPGLGLKRALVNGLDRYAVSGGTCGSADPGWLDRHGHPS